MDVGWHLVEPHCAGRPTRLNGNRAPPLNQSDDLAPTLRNACDNAETVNAQQRVVGEDIPTMLGKELAKCKDGFGLAVVCSDNVAGRQIPNLIVHLQCH